MMRHEFLQQLDALGRDHVVKILHSGGEYVAQWDSVKVHARHIKLKGPDNSVEPVRVPYAQIKCVTGCA